MRVPLILLALAVAVRAALVAAFPDPAFPGASYDVAVARSIAGGDGLNVPFVWLFAELGSRIPAVGVLPVPSNGHWLPLASLLQAPFVSLLGPSAIASAIPGVLVGALAGPLAWAIARDAGVRPGVAVGAGVLAAVPGPLLVLMGQPAGDGLVHVLTPLALWLAARGLRGGAGSFVLAGLVAGLAALVTLEGVLVGAAVALVWLLDRLRWRRSRSGTGGWARVEDSRPVSLGAGAGAAAGFLAVQAPWLARQFATFGAAWPTPADARALWLRSLPEWGSITAAPTLDGFLAQGPAAILASRLAGLGSALTISAVTVCGVILAPFLLVGVVVRGRDAAFRPFLAYAVLLFAAAGLVFPLQVADGRFTHAAVGLAPYATILALEGLAVVFGRLAGARVRSERALGAPVALAVILVAGLGLASAPDVLGRWAEVRDPRLALAAELDARGVPPTDRLLAFDAPGTWYWTGRPVVVTPDDPIGTIESVARAYAVRWLVVEPARVVPAIRDALAGGGRRPAWIGAAGFTVNGADGGPALVLYPICVEPGDDRCGAGA